MKQIAHTPTPWEANKRSIRTMEYDIADLPCFSKSNPDDDEQEANAAFIVRACNSHAELVEAIEKSIALLKDGFDPSGCSNSYEVLPILEKALAAARGDLS